jgi:hypothetical protein
MGTRMGLAVYDYGPVVVAMNSNFFKLDFAGVRVLLLFEVSDDPVPLGSTFDLPTALEMCAVYWNNVR